MATTAPELEDGAVAPAGESEAPSLEEVETASREPDPIADAPGPRVPLFPQGEGSEMRSRAAPPAPLPLPHPASEPAYAGEGEEDLYSAADDGYYHERREASLLNHPYLLAAIVVFGAVIAAVFIVFAFGRDDDTAGGGDNNNSGAIGVTPVASSPPSVPAGALQVNSISTATVREGPGRDYLEIGLLQQGQKVNIVGRDEDASWLQIIFPTNSQLKGWVRDSALELPDDILTRVDVADDSTIARSTAVAPTQAHQATTAPTATDEPGDEADVGIVIVADCSPGSEIVVRLTNSGNVEFTDQPVHVTVSNGDSVEYDKRLEADLAPGQGSTLKTGVDAAPPNMTVTVVLEGIEDVDASNNLAACTVSGSMDSYDTQGSNNNEATETPPTSATPGED
jgi:uncharacterized protein YraI